MGMSKDQYQCLYGDLKADFESEVAQSLQGLEGMFDDPLERAVHGIGGLLLAVSMRLERMENRMIGPAGPEEIEDEHEG